MSPRSCRIRARILVVCCLIFLAGYFVLPSQITGQPVFASSATTESTSSEQNDTGIMMPAIEHSSASAIVIETNRQRSLYALNVGEHMNIPAAAKIMTALIACERLSLDTQVTVSKVAAAAAEDEDSPDEVILKSGDKYPLKYLLCRLLYYSSDSAALAIAEQISSVEEKFVELMNAKAASMQMSGTVFVNCTGEPVYSDIDGIGQDPASLPVDLQYTTLADMALLVYQASANQTFNEILSNPTQFIVLDGSTLVPMSNKLADLWTRSEGVIKGAFYCESAGRTYLVAIGTVNTINLIAVTAGGAPKDAANDLMALFRGCKSYYVSTPLVVAGDEFTGENEQTVDGEVFGLVYKQTVYYVHPNGKSYLKDTVRYTSFGPFSRPIQRSMTVGQVVFELNDGTLIAVDVVPDRQILSSISIVDKALSELQNNGNLTVLLLCCGIVLVLILLYQVFAGLGRLLHLVRLIVHEKRSRR